MATIRDVAKRANVSISTVSRVLNHNSLVVPEKRERVLNAIQELGFQPNGLARSLIHRRTQTIGVMVPDISDFFFAEVVKGMEDAAHALGWNLILSSTYADANRILDCLKLLAEKRVDGIVFTKVPVSQRCFETIKNLSIPAVLVASNSDFQIPTVGINREQAVFDAIRFLLEQGHRQIGMISGPLTDRIGSVPKLSGFFKALELAGIAVQSEQIFYAEGYDYDSGKAGIEALMRRNAGLTAVFAASDELALGIYSYAYEKKLRIPADLSVVGFDNVRVARMFNPPLTTVSQPLYEIGRRSIMKLVGMITGDHTAPVEDLLSHHVEIRSSVTKIS